jgi:hypothetical protein
MAETLNAWGVKALKSEKVEGLKGESPGQFKIIPETGGLPGWPGQFTFCEQCIGIDAGVIGKARGRA